MLGMGITSHASTIHVFIMIVIGLTGGIASGKSQAAAYFANHHVPIIDTDLIARELVAPEQKALNAITHHFGKEILQQDGTLDRTKLRDIIFTHAQERHWLTQLLHPLIRTQVRQRITALKKQHCLCATAIPYCLVVIPLLVENQAYDLLDRILVIDVDEAIQRQRLQARDQITTEQADAILQAQASRQTRLAAADDVICNNHDLVALKNAVAAQHAIYVKNSKKSIG